MLTAQREFIRNAQSTQGRAPRKAVNQASPLSRFVVGFDLSQPPARSADTSWCLRTIVNTAGLWWASKYRSTETAIRQIIFYPLHFSADVLGLAVLARTGRLHSAAVGDIVLL